MDALISDEMISRLNQLQHELLNKKIPVLIIFEGSSGRVIGRVINELIRCLEPRGIIYHHFDPSESTDPRSVLDFLKHTPGNGSIALYDRSWYSAIIERYNEDEKKKDLDRMLDMCNDFERYLVHNGVHLIKIILRASESAVKEYGSEYGPNGPKRSFLSMDHIDPVKYREVMFDHVFERTNTSDCPWNNIPVRELKDTFQETAETIALRIEQRINGEPVFVYPEMELIYPNPREGLELNKDCDHYKSMLNDLSEELSELQMKLSLSDRSMAVCFEGWDASGKGSSIKHLCHALNPRGYTIYQTKAPNDEESQHTYLWRFSKGIPKKGHISIFDRTWYGRMMVEHIEGFCTEEEYQRSPNEINTVERSLTNNGTIVIKFWMDVSPDEQLARFEKRMNDPLKRWKMTDEDWRNREKWDDYDKHVDIMIETTNTEDAPWTVIESDNKKYARVKVLKTVVDTLKRELGKDID